MIKFHATPISLNLIHLIATIAGIVWICISPFQYINLVFIFVGYFLLAGVGHEIFYHRYFCHKSFETYLPVQWVGLVLGVLAGRGSPTDWTAIHRYHHKFADSDLDPHNPRKEKWRAFFPYFFLYDQKINPFIVKDLLKSPVQRFINNYYNLIIILFAVLFAVIDLNLFFYLWVIPMAITGWMISLGTVLSHTYGYRNFNSNDKSTNNFIMSILLWGQGWHNNHHAQPTRWDLRINWWEIDPCAWVIRCIKR
jgi:stearoyl-CoA desaturase (delta-9 desaturase)